MKNEMTGLLPISPINGQLHGSGTSTVCGEWNHSCLLDKWRLIQIKVTEMCLVMGLRPWQLLNYGTLVVVLPYRKGAGRWLRCHPIKGWFTAKYKPTHFVS